MTTSNQFSLSSDTTSLFQIFNLPKANSSYLFSDIIKIVADETPGTQTSEIELFNLPQNTIPVSEGNIITQSDLVKLLLNSMQLDNNQNSAGAINLNGKKFLINGEELKSFIKKLGLERTSSVAGSSPDVIIEISPALLAKLSTEINNNVTGTPPVSLAEGNDNISEKLQGYLKSGGSKKEKIKIIFRKLESTDSDTVLSSGQKINTAGKLNQLFNPGLVKQENNSAGSGKTHRKGKIQEAPVLTDDQIPVNDTLQVPVQNIPVVENSVNPEILAGNVITVPEEAAQTGKVLIPDQTIQTDVQVQENVTAVNNSVTEEIPVLNDAAAENTTIQKEITTDTPVINADSTEENITVKNNDKTPYPTTEKVTVAANDTKTKISNDSVKENKEITVNSRENVKYTKPQTNPLVEVVVEDTNSDKVLNKNNNSGVQPKPVIDNFFTLIGEDGNVIKLQVKESNYKPLLNNSKIPEALQDVIKTGNDKPFSANPAVTKDIEIQVKTNQIIEIPVETTENVLQVKNVKASAAGTGINTEPEIPVEPVIENEDTVNVKTEPGKTTVNQNTKPAEDGSSVKNVNNEKYFANSSKSFPANFLGDKPVDKIYSPEKITASEQTDEEKNLYEIIIPKTVKDSPKVNEHIPYSKNVERFFNEKNLSQDFNTLDYDNFKRETFFINRNSKPVKSNEDSPVKNDNSNISEKVNQKLKENIVLTSIVSDAVKKTIVDAVSENGIQNENMKENIVSTNIIADTTKKTIVDTVPENKIQNEKPEKVEPVKVQNTEKDAAAENKSGSNSNSKDTGKNDTADHNKFNNSSHTTETQERAASQRTGFGEILSADKQVPIDKGFTADIRNIRTTELLDEVNKMVLKGEKTNATLQLSPEHLGKVKITIDVINSTVNTKIEVENESVRQFVQNNVEQLKDSLHQNGMQLSSFTISLATGEQKSAGKFRYKNPDKPGNNKSNISRDEEITINSKSMGYNTYEYLA